VVGTITLYIYYTFYREVCTKTGIKESENSRIKLNPYRCKTVSSDQVLTNLPTDRHQFGNIWIPARAGMVII